MERGERRVLHDALLHDPALIRFVEQGDDLLEGLTGSVGAHRPSARGIVADHDHDALPVGGVERLDDRAAGQPRQLRPAGQPLAVAEDAAFAVIQPMTGRHAHAQSLQIQGRHPFVEGHDLGLLRVEPVAQPAELATTQQPSAGAGRCS